MPTNRHVINETIKAYAKVALHSADQAGGREKVVEVRNQFGAIVELLLSDVKLRNALSQGTYTPEQRGEIARNVFAQFDTVVCETLAVMVTRGDVSLLRNVYNTYEELVGQELNFNIVDVTTVVELDDNLRNIITSKAAADLGTDVVLCEQIDKNIMGGIVMSSMGKRVDASVASRLEQARLALSKSTDGGEC